jgi:hypothetical protein
MRAIIFGGNLFGGDQCYCADEESPTDLDMEILHKEFTVDDAEQETLVNNNCDAAQDFVSLYDFSYLAESDDNTSPRALQYSFCMLYKNFC